jgi:hypothetical protein
MDLILCRAPSLPRFRVRANNASVGDAIETYSHALSLIGRKENGSRFFAGRIWHRQAPEVTFRLPLPFFCCFGDVIEPLRLHSKRYRSSAERRNGFPLQCTCSVILNWVQLFERTLSIPDSLPLRAFPLSCCVLPPLARPVCPPGTRLDAFPATCR